MIVTCLVRFLVVQWGCIAAGALPSHRYEKTVGTIAQGSCRCDRSLIANCSSLAQVLKATLNNMGQKGNSKGANHPKAKAKGKGKGQGAVQPQLHQISVKTDTILVKIMAYAPRVGQCTAAHS